MLNTTLSWPLCQCSTTHPCITPSFPPVTTFGQVMITPVFLHPALAVTICYWQHPPRPYSSRETSITVQPRTPPQPPRCALTFLFPSCSTTPLEVETSSHLRLGSVHIHMSAQLPMGHPPCWQDVQLRGSHPVSVPFSFWYFGSNYLCCIFNSEASGTPWSLCCGVSRPASLPIHWFAWMHSLK